MMRRFADGAGTAVPSTRADLLDLAEHYGLIVRDDHGKRLVAQPLPLVSETGVLTAEEVALEDRVRWMRQFTPLILPILAVLRHGDLGPRDCTVARIAVRIGYSTESTRHALAVLTDDEDLFIDPDPETAADFEPLAVTVDWDEYDRKRLPTQT